MHLHWHNEIFPGYVLYRRDRQNGKCGGGVLIAIKSDLQSIRRRSLEGPTAEHLMVELYPLNRTKFLSSVFYRPPNNDVTPLLELQNSLNMLNNSCKLVPNINWSREFSIPSTNGSHKDELFCDMMADNFLSHYILVTLLIIFQTRSLLILLESFLPITISSSLILNFEFKRLKRSYAQFTILKTQPFIDFAKICLVRRLTSQYKQLEH